jgi:hypothetical protein
MKTHVHKHADEERDYELHTSGVAVEGASSRGIIFVRVKGLAP